MALRVLYGARLNWGSLRQTKLHLLHQFAGGVGVLSSVIICVLPDKSVKLEAECGGSSYSRRPWGAWQNVLVSLHPHIFTAQLDYEGCMQG